MVRRATLAAALFLAGCGSSGPHLSMAAYTRQGDAICSRYQADIHGLGQPTKLTDIGPFITKALPILERTVSALGGIHPPSDREAQYGKFLAAARGTVTRAKALRAAATKADAPTVQQLLGAAARASAPRAALARAAGLSACALS
ncbi:MAG: hypothetical protein QOF12_2497 [Solirubrobacteraceae bacterium]|jgi:hypothetical protein|nr:hypothetical protein [Solirubrobacteraceae bacterium]